MTNLSVNVLWFKRDLRIDDHAPFVEAAKRGPVLPLYIIEPELWRQADSSIRHWHFIRQSLIELDQALQTYRATLIVRIGHAVTALEEIRREIGSFILWSHEETGNHWSYRRDQAVTAWCRTHQIPWHECPSHGVMRCLKNRDTWSKMRTERMRSSILTRPDFIHFHPLASDTLPSENDCLFGNPITGQVQTGGRSHGIQCLESFLNNRGKHYVKSLSKPQAAFDHGSRLSAHISYGTLSVREIEQSTQAKIELLRNTHHPGASSMAFNLSSFLSRLAWRCHFVQKLEQQASIEYKCMHPAFEGMREPYFREELFEAWKYGRTGYPFVDACMRSLIAHGWINFRMRAMLVSFASYHLWLDWRKTAPYLAGLFTDYEPGIHYAQYQMQSGVTGINTIRIYNPIKQSMEHDPDGTFILKYIPQLRDLPLAWVHQPWKFTSLSYYPGPIVDPITSIHWAREQLRARIQQEGFRRQAESTHQKLGSRKKQKQTARKQPPKAQISIDFDAFMPND